MHINLNRDSYKTTTAKNLLLDHIRLNFHAWHFLVEFGFFELSNGNGQHGALNWLHTDEFVETLMMQKRKYNYCKTRIDDRLRLQMPYLKAMWMIQFHLKLMIEWVSWLTMSSLPWGLHMQESANPFCSMVVLVPLPLSVMVMGPLTPLYSMSTGALIVMSLLQCKISSRIY